MDKMFLDIDDVTDRHNPPQVWFMPVNGAGLLTTGTMDRQQESISIPDCGDWYGYCYLPKIVVASGSAGMYSQMHSSVHACNYVSIHPYNMTTPEPARFPFPYHSERHPYLATRENAVAWLKDRGLTGEVMRYAHHKHITQRGPIWDYEPIGREYRWKQYQPWVTAGTTDIITAEKGTAITQILTLAKGFTLHEPDGTIRDV